MKRSILGRATALTGALAMTMCSGIATSSTNTTPGIDIARLLAAGGATQTTVADMARYTVVLTDEPLATYSGQPVKVQGVARSFTVAPRTTRGRIDVQSAEAHTYVAMLHDKQQAFVADISAQLGRSIELEGHFQHALNAVVVKLTAAEAAQLKQRDDVQIVEKEHAVRVLTDHSSAFINATKIWDGSYGGPATMGEGTVIGELDTGVAWDDPSFAGVGPIDGYVFTNPLGAGNYLGTCAPGGPDAGHCNNKLIGMWGYSNTAGSTNTNGLTYSAADDESHGSHTASTAAGNARTGTYLNGTFKVTGMAPHANIIAYKICYPTSTGAWCLNTASTAAANQAVADGVVDAINFSISGGTSPWTETTSIAFRNAVGAGIFVAAAGGNSGPGPATITHIEPWTATVAASSEDRALGMSFKLNGGSPSTQAILLVPGSAPQATADVLGAPIIQSPTFGKFSTTNDDGCSAFPPNTFLYGGTPAIAVLSLSQSITSACGSAVRKANATAAGAAGVIYVDTTYLNLAASGNAWAMLTSDWNNVAADLTVNPALTVNIPKAGAALPAQGDVVADFSSRGPAVLNNQLIIKPEISAPGVNILAAGATSTGSTAASPNLPNDPNRIVVESGTSMATPHVAGSALLLRALHPTWTPVQIRSALMMTSVTANLVNANGSATTALDRGAGRIDVAAAAKSGLIMDETNANFVAADPANGGDMSKLNLPSMAQYNCIGTCSFTRTVQSARALGTPKVTWTLTITGMPAGSTTVSPTGFTINAAPATSTFTVNVNNNNLPDGISQGTLTLTPSDPTIPVAHMPIMVRKGPPVMSIPTKFLSATQLPNTVTTQAVTVTNLGGPTLNWSTSNTSLPLTVINTSYYGAGILTGVYNLFSVPNASWQAQDFDIPARTTISKLTAKSYAIGTNGLATLTAALAPRVTFAIFRDGTFAGVGNTPDGYPENENNPSGMGNPPVWMYSGAFGSPGVTITNTDSTGAGGLILDLTAAGLPAARPASAPPNVGTFPLTLDAGRYWLVVYPELHSNGCLFGSNPSDTNPCWYWSVSADPQIGNPAVIAQPGPAPKYGDAWDANTLPSDGFSTLATDIESVVDCQAPAGVTFSGMNGALATNASGSGTVKFDSTGLAPGTYTGELCVTSNDTANSLKVIPLSLTVAASLAMDNAQATPTVVNSGETSLLTVHVAPGTAPASTGVQVKVNLSSIGGSDTQTMFDDGTHGDAIAGDGIYSYAATVPVNTTSGTKNFPVSVSDAQARTAGPATITLNVAQQTALAVTAESATPSTGSVGDTTHLAVTVTPGANPTSSGIQVTADLSSIGGSATQALNDDGSGSYSYDASFAPGTTPGVKLIPVSIHDGQGRSASTIIGISVLTPGSPSGTGLPIANTVIPGNSVLLAVSTVPGSNPTSTSMTVTVDLTQIGGSAAQTFYDDGTHGDLVAGDGIYSFQAPVASATPLDTSFNMMVTIADAQSRTGQAVISLRTGNDRIFISGFDTP